MGFIVRDNARVIRPDAAGKVIKAEDFWAWCDAQDTVADAVRRQDAILANAKAAYLAEQQRGYQEGNEKARLEQARKMTELATRTVEYFTRVEGEMVELVVNAMRHIVHGYDDRERVLEAVRSCLAMVRSQKHLRLRVHPVQVDMVKARMNELLQQYPGLENVHVVADKSMERDACAMETEVGTVEASMNAQVEVLRETLRRVFADPARAMAAPASKPEAALALQAEDLRRRTLV